MTITVLTHALVTILIAGLIIWLISFLPFDGRIKMILRVVVIVLALVSIIRSLDLLAISSPDTAITTPAPSTKITE